MGVNFNPPSRSDRSKKSFHAMKRYFAFREGWVKELLKDTVEPLGTFNEQYDIENA